jgi:hypothetical protein
MDIAIRAPITEVFGVNPIREIICIHTIAERTDTIMLSTRVLPSRAFTWVVGSPLSLINFSLTLKYSDILPPYR